MNFLAQDMTGFSFPGCVLVLLTLKNLDCTWKLQHSRWVGLDEGAASDFSGIAPCHTTLQKKVSVKCHISKGFLGTIAHSATCE